MKKNRENTSPNIRGKGIPISPQLKESALYIDQRLKSIGKTKKEILSVIKRVCKIGKASYYRILRGRSQIRQFRGPKYRMTENDITKIDEIICNFFEEIKIPSKTDVFEKMKKDIENNISFKKCGRTTFYQLLRRAGYKAKLSVKVTRELKIQEPAIRKQRIEYLRRKRELEKDYNFIYLDETYIHKNYLRTKILLPLRHSKRLRIRLQMAKGHRFSVIYAGGMDGFVKGSLMVKMNSEINSEKFEEWLQNQLLPNLEEPSVIVFDNARTHSRILDKKPNSNSKVGVMREWLKDNGIQFDQKLTKKNLYALIKVDNQKRKYAVDQIIRAAGHIPLRSPPYCCELNPIEKIWAEWKRRIGYKNLGNSTQKFLTLIKDVFEEITVEHWRSCIRNLVKVEFKFWTDDNMIENQRFEDQLIEEQMYCDNILVN